MLKRAIRTLWIVLDEMDLMWIPVHRSWRLNERHYGALQGLNKAETAAKFGEDQVKIWRRSYDIPPPALTPDDERYPGHDPRYQGVPKEELPLTECLKDTVARFLPLLARDHRSGGQGRQAGDHRRARQQPARAGEVPRQRHRGRHRRAEHPDRRCRWSTSWTTTLKPLKHYYLGDPERSKAAMDAVANAGEEEVKTFGPRMNANTHE